ncbi:hypothetical protein F5Y16DRAFT_377487 [Xylariaceae sp. FL0255]|nr:hypothetical protein F5Y16DRAFT_377487 [Xylariaceae sp. FL0255]
MASYGELSQSDNEDDRPGGPSPFESLSSAPSSSPMPFLPALESTFTPLSMDSDFQSTHEVFNQQSTHGSQIKVGNTATLPTTERDQHQLAQSAQATDLKAYQLVLPSPPSSTLSPPRMVGQTSPDTDILINSASNGVEVGAQKPNGAVTLDTIEETSQPIIFKPKPLVRTASTKGVSLRHPVPDVSSRYVSRASNIAQIEATAEKLSMTSSIEDAIRDLHDEQKRADSRRSSILAASIASIPESDEPVTFPILSKQISRTSSIHETNTAARYGGYSPAGYVMSPSSPIVSTTTRLRSGSGSNGMSNRSDVDMISNSMSRHGPGKSSVRSVRSVSKPVLMNIAEIEPTTLTAAAMDEADRLAEEPQEEETLHLPHLYDADSTPNANEYHGSAMHDYWDQVVEEARREQQYYDDRPPSAGSDGTFAQAERAFADFDGAHCSPDVDLDDAVNFQTMFASPIAEEPPFVHFDSENIEDEDDDEAARARPDISRPMRPTVRPKSYLDPQTGETMIYYPARVPMMLNLPQKLSSRPKADVRNMRRSKVMSAMPEVNRKSWLPDFEPLGHQLGIVENDPALAAHASAMDLQHNEEQDESHFTVDFDRPPTEIGHRKSQMTVRAVDSDQSLVESDNRKSRISLLPVDLDRPPTELLNRKSRMSMLYPDKRSSQIPDLKNLPPQARASVFFDMPSDMPSVQLKDGSATNALDDILDASAKAPVSAFTDHAFAGSLGNEVYGVDKKRKSHMKRASTNELSTPKQRNSIFHIRKISGLSRHSSSKLDQHDPDLVAEEEVNLEDEERRPLSANMEGEPQHEVEEEEIEDEEDPAYNGPPTTLLAELQMRKQQQKMRTRPAASAFPNGMHSTLLQMDTVAEIERRARKTKRVNLAWEDPNTKVVEEDDDEDVPLGLLSANKAGHNDLMGAMAEANRPLGLMERRDMEDNEPLSVRRNRLHGRETGPVQRMTLVRNHTTDGTLAIPSPQLRVVTPETDEEEGETLGARMRRLIAKEDENPLPQARPVSTAFSAELLSQLGDTFKDEEGEKADEEDKNKAPPTEEQETLGQRRKRLQAEREARERELARAKLNGGRTSATPSPGPALNTRRSMADILGNPATRTPASDPRADAQRAQQEQAARYQAEQGQRLAALRQQMPASLSTPNLVKAGGFMAGRYNDGTAGGYGQARGSTAMNGFASHPGLPNPAMNASTYGNAFRVGGTMSSYMQPMQQPMMNPYANPYAVNPYGATITQPQPPGQMDRVERWRQGVYP